MEKLKVQLFEEEGFIRKKCPKCGSYFWTLNPDQKYCGDQPCVDYTFLDKPPTLRKFTLSEVREGFLRFMEKHGHTRIKRYPVVARWREDVYLVGASIYDFQPWCTEGIIEPPANPLTISQPCIRLTDLESVGRSGRHLTMFEMMAHHAFNYPWKKVYWMDKTVELAFEYFTKALGVPPDKISFKESMWSGGGNAGEAFEVLIEGLEVATLVFMHYKVKDGKLIEMPNKIVDTGYGLERICWLSHGAPTIYDVVFRDLITWLSKEASISKVDTKILTKISKYSGKFDIEKTTIAKFHEYLANKLNMTLREFEDKIIPLENIYMLADHTRALVFMIGDGIVPSNTGAGYLARLLIRRCLRAITKLGLSISLADIVEKQIKIISKEYPEYLQISDDILDIITTEEERYYKTIKRGKEIIARDVQKLRRKGVNRLPLNKLIELYDSHGLDPYFVKEEYSKYGIEVNVPDNFYVILAERHQKGKVKAEKRMEELPRVDELMKLPETVPLYYQYPDKFEFEAKIIKVIHPNIIILDRTAFYPEGGGQPSDKGVIVTPKGNIMKVLDVQKLGKVIIHKVDKLTLDVKEGILVKGVVDRERRLSLTRSHTATHILLAASRMILGPHVWQAGAKKGVERSHLDITHHKPLTRDEIEKIEILANRIVCENRKINIRYMDRVKAEAKYGFTLYQGGVIPEKTLRIVEIEGIDAQACGGTHCKSTGEVGLIKILKAIRIQDGVVRLEFSVGEYALKNIHKEENILLTVAKQLKAPIEGLPKAVETLLSRIRVLRHQNEILERKILKLEFDQIISNPIRIGEINVVVKEEEDYNKALKLTDMLNKIKDKYLMVLYGIREKAIYYIIKCTPSISKKYKDHVRRIAEVIKRIIGGGYGGREDFIQGGAPYVEVKYRKLKNSLLDLIEKTLKLEEAK